jgi:hypothetical protein
VLLLAGDCNQIIMSTNKRRELQGLCMHAGIKETNQQMFNEHETMVNLVKMQQACLAYSSSPVDGG